MKHKNNLIAFTIISCLANITLPSFAQSPTPQSGFRCDTSSDIPTTIYQNRQGVQEPWIKWVSNYFSGSGYNPVERCKIVSSRLESYRRNKQLKYLTIGKHNNQKIICVASRYQGACEGIVYTLKPGQNALKALNNLFTWRTQGVSDNSNYETSSIPYIEVGSRLDDSTPIPSPPKTDNPRGL